MLLPLCARALTLPRLAGAMSTVTVSPAMAILDKLIDHVTKLPATSPSSSSHASGVSSTSVSYLPSHTTDIAWRPLVPIGHTKYTWVGDDDAPATVTAAPATSASASSSTAASASSLTSAAIPRPDTAAAAAAALPVPHAAAKAPKEKKAGAQPTKGGAKAEEKKTDQPDISRVDIRVGQIVRAWKHPEGQTNRHRSTVGRCGE